MYSRLLARLIPPKFRAGKPACRPPQHREKLWLLVRQAHDERQGDIESRDVLVVEMANMPSDSFAPDRDRLVGHHLRSQPQAVPLARIDRHPKVGCVAAVGRHLADHDRHMCRRQSIRLDDHCGTWLAVVARCCNRYHVAALHRASNSETASIHPRASNSRDRTRPATSFAILLRTIFERASGTISRNSRRPRARRRSRMAFIRSAANAIWPSILDGGQGTALQNAN